MCMYVNEVAARFWAIVLIDRRCSNRTLSKVVEQTSLVVFFALFLD